MFLVRWIRLLLSLPPLWLGRAAVMVDIRGGVALLKAAYDVGQDPETAGLALAYIQKFQGDEALLAQARAWSERRVRPEIAGVAGVVESIQPGRLEQARQWHAMAGATGRDDPNGSVEFLGLLLAARTGKQEMQRVAGEIVAGHKSNATAMQLALTVLMYGALSAGRWEEAKERAEHMLGVSKHPPAIIVLWALAARAGEEKRAGALIRKLDRVPWSQKLQYWVAANRAIGRTDEADRAIAEHAPAPTPTGGRT